MLHTPEGTHDGPDGARVVEKQRDERGRRWYHRRPSPKRRTDLMGLNATWWALFWLIALVLLVEPWWW